MMNNLELTEKCTAILNRCLDRLPSYIRYDRKRKAEELINLANEVYDKSQNQSISSSSVGALGIGASAGASVGAMLGPLGLLAGGIGGALLGKAFRSITSGFSTDNHSYGIYNVGEKIDKHDWGYLISDPNLTLRLIKDQIIDTLYPQRLNRMDVEMLMTLANVAADSMIETINCDLGIVTEIERYSGNGCISDDHTEFEKEINNLGYRPSRNQREVASLKILMTENIRYENNWTEPRINSLKDMRRLCIWVEQLLPNQHFLTIVPKHMLYNPGFQNIRKSLFMNGRLKAIMDLKRPMMNGVQTELCALIFSGNITERILLLSNTWDHSITFPLGKQGHTQHRKLLHNAVIKALSHPDKADGWPTVSYRSIGMPYVVTPTYRSKKKQGKSKMVELGQVASLEQPCRLRYSSVTGCLVGNEHLTKETPLKPIDKRSLDVEEREDLSKWYHIKTDHVVFLQIWNGRIFTGYMENVKGENFFLHFGPKRHVIVLGVNNESGLTPQYLAQILQSRRYAISEQLLSAAYYADGFRALQTAVCQTYIPMPSIASQNKTIAETAVQLLDQSNLEWKQKFEEYNRSVKNKRHELTNRLAALDSSIKRVLEYCKKIGNNQDLKFDLNQTIGSPFPINGVITKTTVNNEILNIEKVMPDVIEYSTYLADVDKTYGDPEIFNVIEELRNTFSRISTSAINVIEENEYLSTSIDQDLNVEFPLNGFRESLHNIYWNAYKHGFYASDKEVANPTIKISWSVDGDFVTIKIANNGAPIVDGVDYFDRSSRGRRRDQTGHMSEGIGNSEIKDLITRYNGNIALKSVKDDDEFQVAYIITLKLTDKQR